MTIFKIEMLDNEGAHVEWCDAEEQTSGPEVGYCEDEHQCLSHAAYDTVTVYLWTTADDMTYLACALCIGRDPYARLVEYAEPVINPETGVAVYPWMTSEGFPVESDGTVTPVRPR